MAQIQEATAYVRVFEMSDDELTVTVELSKAGDAFDEAAGDVSEIGGGWYKIALTEIDTGTVGDLAYRCMAGAETVAFVDQVLPNPGDDPWAVELPGAYAAGTAGDILGSRLDVEVSSRSTLQAEEVWEAEARELTGFGTLVADIWEAGTRTLTDLTGFELSVDGILAIWEQAVAALSESGTVGKFIVEQFQGMLTVLGEPAGDSVVADIAAVQTTADAIETVLGTPADGTIADDLADVLAEITTGVVLTTASREAVADTLLDRNINGGGSGGRTVGSALAISRNKVVVSGGTLTVYDTDDTTVLFTAAITSAAGNPITSIDPV